MIGEIMGAGSLRASKCGVLATKAGPWEGTATMSGDTAFVCACEYGCVSVGVCVFVFVLGGAWAHFCCICCVLAFCALQIFISDDADYYTNSIGLYWRVDHVKYLYLDNADY